MNIIHISMLLRRVLSWCNRSCNIANTIDNRNCTSNHGELWIKVINLKEAMRNRAQKRSNTMMEFSTIMVEKRKILKIERRNGDKNL